MKTKEQVYNFSDVRFYRAFGVKKPVFEKMLQLLEEKYAEEHKRGGKPPKISVFDRLCMFFLYFHDYLTLEAIANEYNIAVSTSWRLITWSRNVLIKSGEFSLPGKRVLADDPTRIAQADVTECEDERPKKNSANHIQARKNAIPTNSKS